MTHLPESPGAVEGSVQGPSAHQERAQAEAAATTTRSDRGPWIFLAVVVPIVLIIGGVMVWIAVNGDQPREPVTIEIVVPAGTQDRMDAGEKVVVMPTRLEFRVGDMIHIVNEDDVRQSVGPYVLDAGKDMILQYGAPGVYEGYCPLSEGERYEIVVRA